MCQKTGGLGGDVYSDGAVSLCKSVKISGNKQVETTASNTLTDTKYVAPFGGFLEKNGAPKPFKAPELHFCFLNAQPMRRLSVHPRR